MKLFISMIETGTKVIAPYHRSLVTQHLISHY